MKSIKKKAEDYVSGFHPSIQKMCKESFEAGANYVLEQIENILTNPRRYINTDKSMEEGMIDDIIKRIEQLKVTNK